MTTNNNQQPQEYVKTSAEYPLIQLAHPDICAFYANHPHISPEIANLAFIEMFERTHHNPAGIGPGIVPVSATASPPPPPNSYRKQTIDMNDVLDQLRDTITTLTSRISQEYLFIKTEYINEFRSVWSQLCCVSRRDILLENNRKLIHSVEQLLYDVRNIKRTHSSIGEKTENIIKHFHKIVHSNIETILSKPAETANMIPEFIHNFETNSTHMIHTTQTLLTDYMSAKETLAKKITDSFAANGESAISAYCKFIYESKDFLQSVSPHVSDKSASSQNIVSLLSRLYNTGYIQPEETEPSISILSRDDKPTICIQQLQIKDRNINTDEIARFLQITKEKNVHGILVSQYTGITSKPNLYIDIHHNRVYVYVHSLEYSPEKLQSAIDIVDTISTKLTDFNNSIDQKYTVPKEVLDEINREYQMFIAQKETIMTTMKESYKKIMTQIEELRFVSLDKFLSTRYSYFKKQGFLCNLCNTFSVSTLKGLAAHKRGCTRKLCSVNTSSACSSSVSASSSSSTSTIIEIESIKNHIDKPIIKPVEIINTPDKQVRKNARVYPGAII
jgi:uncharacterized membrane-anchored protein YhcB (DUF1043 family)